MSYYDPKIYNFANLNEEDCTELSMLVWHMCDIIEPLYVDGLACEFESIKPLTDEITIKMLDEIIANTRLHIIEMLVNYIDRYDDEMVEQDTDDYFYGCYIPDIFKNNEICRKIIGNN